MVGVEGPVVKALVVKAVEETDRLFLLKVSVAS
ncbi:hypothetical protein DSM03_1193 [Leeuwenhoekiella aestuarii]|nr:hypothetical protein DSM03_1193 [Leeuwenhoekiella aestuarii]